MPIAQAVQAASRKSSDRGALGLARAMQRAPATPVSSAAPPIRTTLHASPDAEATVASRYLLVVGDGITATHILPRTGNVALGRGAACDVTIDHPTISRRHAVLHLGPPLAVEDLGSVNGTRVQGQRIPPQRPTPLLEGELVYLGSTMITVQLRHTPPRARLLTHGAFEVRVAHECRRATATGSSFAVVHLRFPRRVAPPVLEAALSAALRPIDVVAYYAPGEYEALLPLLAPAESEASAAALCERMGEAGAGARSGVVCFPRDGRSAETLILEAARHLVDGAGVLPAGDGDGEGQGAMAELHRVVERLARSTLSVLIRGETGVGKERMAELVHRLSPRADKAFLQLNCAALSESLLQSELFGHERGAFTGAVAVKPGLFETAHGGTVFLDEVGDLPASIQAKLLRVIEDRRVLRVGGLEARSIDVRFVAATNRDLEHAVETGAFRRDLYFRLDGITLFVPPLRERSEEIEGLARELAAAACHKWGHEQPPTLTAEALAALTTYPWPGNIRELRNAIERAVLLCGVGEIRPEHLKLPLRTAPVAPLPRVAPPTVQHLAARPPDVCDERRRVIDALERCAGNQTHAARLLGVSRRTLVNRLNALGLPRPRKARLA